MLHYPCILLCSFLCSTSVTIQSEIYRMFRKCGTVGNIAFCFRSSERWYWTVEWPPHFPNLTPLDFCLWGHLKAKVHAVKVRMITIFKSEVSLSAVNHNTRQMTPFPCIGENFCFGLNGECIEHIIGQLCQNAVLPCLRNSMFSTKWLPTVCFCNLFICLLKLDLSLHYRYCSYYSGLIHSCHLIFLYI
jgi:hypothetical protein